MMRTTIREVVLVGVVLALTISMVSARQDDAPELPESFDEPIPLYPPAVLGDLTHTISSSNADAQVYFDQGFQLMYAFTKEDAARSFREAWTRDPECAICYWGEAWAWGSYLNGPMRPFEAPHAYAAIQAALTGHLVLSTLHTNTAVGAVTRLQDMGIEPFLFSSSLLGSLAQRLAPAAMAKAAARAR